MSGPTIKAIQVIDSLVHRATESSDIGFAMIDSNNVLISVNARLLSIIGYRKPAELLGKPISILMQHIDTVKDMLDALSECGTWRGETRALRKDNTSVVCDLFANLVEYGTNNSRYVFVAFIENTEFKRTVKSLSESHSYMERLLNGLPSSVLLTDANMKILWANKKALEMNSNAIGSTCQRAYAKRDEVCDGCPIKKSVNTGEIEEAVIHHESHIDHPGHWFDVAVPIRNEAGKVIEVISMATEVTSEIRSRETLLETEVFSSKLLESSPNPIVVFNSDSSIRYVNPALSKLTGFRFLELLSEKPPYPWCSEQLRQNSTFDLQRPMRKEYKGVEQLIISKSRKPLWVEINTVPIRLNRKLKCYLSIWTNVTERHEEKNSMRYYIRELTKAQEDERRRIARELHDETAQQLACLYTEIDKIIMSIAKPKEQIVDRLGALRLRVDYMMGEIRNLCSLLRPYYLDDYGLAASLELLVEMAKKEWGLEANIHVLGKEQRLSSETEIQLFRIAQEALHNIRKHSMATEATLEVCFSDHKVKLTVADNGIGFKVPRSISSFGRKGKLGLIGISERVDLLNGTFRVSSKLGSGTKLEVEVRF